MKVKGEIDFCGKGDEIEIKIVTDKGMTLVNRIIPWKEIKNNQTFYLHLDGLTVLFHNITQIHSLHPLSCEISYKTEYINI